MGTQKATAQAANSCMQRPFPACSLGRADPRRMIASNGYRLVRAAIPLETFAADGTCLRGTLQMVRPTSARPDADRLLRGTEWQIPQRTWRGGPARVRQAQGEQQLPPHRPVSSEELGRCG